MKYTSNKILCNTQLENRSIQFGYRSTIRMIVSIVFISSIWSCDQEGISEDQSLILKSETFTNILNLPSQIYNYADIEYPAHFNNRDVSDIDNTPADNPITDIGATLGRVLFYDKNLSANNTIACASCHLQSNGFADNKKLSIGFEGGLTGRNSMGLSNARFYDNGAFFWDQRASSLEVQTLMPIQDHVEMGLTLDELTSKLQTEEYYQYLFKVTFGDEIVTTERISKSLSQFIRSLVSYQSKYDEGLASAGGNLNADFENFTNEENRGKRLFNSRRTNCSSCHETAMFSGDRARNNGLDATTIDQGFGAVTGDGRDDGKFKTHSLRNIALTAPFMHDGRFETLEEVIEHYNSGIQAHPNLDNRLKFHNGNQPRRMNFNSTEKRALVAFLNTLTDDTFINDERFSNPFIE